MRLKDLCDIDENGAFESLEKSDNRGIVHWVAGGSPAKLTTAEGKKLIVEQGILETHNHKIGTIVQLERIGYAIIEEDGLLKVHDLSLIHI